MVRCEYCQLFLPESEAVLSGTHYYCSEEHKSLARK
ncbi:MAG: PP0621 family protein [Gammaproteobacteria bacterium]